MAFAETLAGLRRSRGLTQVALAERAGVNVSQLRKYEAGGSEPSLSALRRLAVALSCTTDALVFGDDPRLPDDQALRLAFEATAFLDDAERATVRELLDAFIARHNARHAEDRPRRPQSPPTDDLNGTVANVAGSRAKRRRPTTWAADGGLLGSATAVCRTRPPVRYRSGTCVETMRSEPREPVTSRDVVGATQDLRN